MAWNSPITWATSQLVTANDLNTQVRDNLNYLHSGKPLVAIIRDNGATYSTTSTSFVDIDSTNLKATILTTTGRIGMVLTGTFYGGDALTLVGLDFKVGGTRLGGSGAYQQEKIGTESRLLTVVAFKTVTPGSTVDVIPQWKTSNASYTSYLFSATGNPQVGFFAWEA